MSGGVCVLISVNLVMPLPVEKSSSFPFTSVSKVCIVRGCKTGWNYLLALWTMTNHVELEWVPEFFFQGNIFFNSW